MDQSSDKKKHMVGMVWFLKWGISNWTKSAYPGGGKEVTVKRFEWISAYVCVYFSMVCVNVCVCATADTAK